MRFAPERLELKVEAALPYFPKRLARTEAQRALFQKIIAIKTGSKTVVDRQLVRASDWLARNMGSATLWETLDPESILIPLPTSSSTKDAVRTGTWILCESLHNSGFGGGLARALIRTQDVESSHAARSQQRRPPGVQAQIQSLAADLRAVRHARALTLVDDIVSSGTTAMAASLVLREAGFDGPVRLFSAAHTVDSAPSENHFKGMIRWRPSSEFANRSPEGFRSFLGEEPPPWDGDPPF